MSHAAPPTGPITPPPLASAAGTWSHERAIVTTGEGPSKGPVTTTETITAIWVIAAEGDHYLATETLCRVSFSSSSPSRSVRVGPGFASAASGSKWEVLVRRTRDFGDRFEASMQGLLGAKLPRPDAPLPARADDPTAFDSDGDGKPGVTLQIGGAISGDVQVVRRVNVVLEGGLGPDGKLVAGEGTTVMEERVLSASDERLASLGAQTVTETRFTLKRTKDGARCPKR